MKRAILLIIPLLLIILGIGSKAKGYGVGKVYEGKRPNCSNSIITDNNGFCIGPDEKSIFLTFDCGYENGYTNSILDTLKENDTKAAFFITGHYLNSSPELVKRMLDEGHLVCNHSYSHKDFPKSSDEEILKDLKRLEDAFYKKFKVEMPKIVRNPRGEYDERTQRLLASNGYKSVFWSLAYVDWHKDLYNGVGYAYNNVMKRIHNGAIILMHTVSKDNMVDLNNIIKKIYSSGYDIKSIEEL